MNPANAGFPLDDSNIIWTPFIDQKENELGWALGGMLYNVRQHTAKLRDARCDYFLAPSGKRAAVGAAQLLAEGEFVLAAARESLFVAVFCSIQQDK